MLGMKQQHEVIEILMQPFRDIIGKDYNRYLNHVCRVYQNCLLLDNNSNNEVKYAITAVFHDIGIWTKHTIDYLDPSIEEAKVYLKENGYENWIEEISLMIFWHHKMSSYHGKFENTIENFRKADWIDVSLGLLTYGINHDEISSSKKRFPNLGFHLFLIKKIFKNFIRHPLDPLPMFKS